MKKRGFTLIELLVVVAVIGILLAVLLPALSGVRRQVQSVQAMSNARQVAIALTAYTADGGFGFNDGPGRLRGGNGAYPPSYLYASDRDDMKFRFSDQRQTHPNAGFGYIHWSRFLFEGDRVQTEAFQSPAVTDGGAPRTNPGPDPKDWIDGQRNDLGQQPPGGRTPTDRQAERVAFAGNAAIFSRNKFADGSGQDPRQFGSNQGRFFNDLVRTTEIDQPSRTALITEFADIQNWRSLMDGEVVKSHRPVDPFMGLLGQTNPIEVPATANFPSFRYPNPDEAAEEIQAWRDVRPGVITGEAGPIINAVGRHHPGETTNFIYADGSGDNLTLRESVRDRRWGEKMYSFDDREVPVRTEVVSFEDAPQ